MKEGGYKNVMEEQSRTKTRKILRWRNRILRDAIKFCEEEEDKQYWRQYTYIRADHLRITVFSPPLSLITTITSLISELQKYVHGVVCKISFFFQFIDDDG